MVCQHCGNLLPEGATVCDQCGAEIPNQSREGGGSLGRRQGREGRPSAGRSGSASPSYPTASSPVYTPPQAVRHPRSVGDKRTPSHSETAAAAEAKRGKTQNKHPVRRRMINWAMVLAVLMALVVVALIGGYVFLKMTDTGQLILARMGREADATALWTYGQELLDQGHVGRAISTYEQALELEPEREDMYQRLTQLADAYEAAGRTGDAEKTYVRMYNEIDKENPFAYREVMRIMENQDRRMELSTFLKMAYENTKDTYFRRQREDMLPSTPTASEEAGTRKMEQDVKLLSAEDYDIYYIIGDEGMLPEDGTKYTTPIHLAEGSYIIRAVAVSSDLVSDEMRISYTISLPTPMAPTVSLAPGVYQKRQRIWLKHVESEDEKLLKQKDNKSPEETATLAKLTDITIYYTIDGQTPTSNSPIFDGEPFYLPDGKCTLKAVSVNGYGKVSNILERTYQVKTNPKKRFNDSDAMGDFVLMKTTKEAFVKKYGSPKKETQIKDETVTGDCVQLDYSWGYARFCLADAGNVIYAFETDSTSVSGPRKTRIGMAEKDVTAMFRDVGQTYDQNGDRSIYYDAASGDYAKLYHMDKTHDRIDYVFVRMDAGHAILTYSLENGKVVKMGMRCEYTLYDAGV